MHVATVAYMNYYKNPLNYSLFKEQVILSQQIMACMKLLYTVYKFFTIKFKYF